MGVLRRHWSQPVFLLTLTALFWAGNAVAGQTARGHVSPYLLRSVDLVGHHRTGMFVNLTAVFAALLAVLLLGESFKFHHGAVLVLVLGGLWLSSDHTKSAT